MIRAFRSELVKLRRRSMLLGAFGATLGFSVLGNILAVYRAGRENGLTVARLSQADGYTAVLQRSEIFLGVVALGIVAIATAQEYSHGTLRNLLVREPRRIRLLAGKTLANLLFVAATVVVGMTVGLIVAELIAPSKGIDTAGWLGSGLGSTLGSAGNVLLAVTGWGVFGAMLAIVLRSPAPAVVIGFAWALPVENLLTAAWSEVGHWLPGQQLAAIAARGNSVSGYTWALGLGAAFVVTAAVGSATLFARRDVAV